jgi:hypothetical protein
MREPSQFDSKTSAFSAVLSQYTGDCDRQSTGPQPCPHNPRNLCMLIHMTNENF